MTRSELTRARDLFRELPQDPKAIRRRVCEALWGLGIADAVGAAGMAEGRGGHIWITWSEGLGDDRGEALAAEVKAPRNRSHVWNELDIRRTPLVQRRRFRTLDELIGRERVLRSSTWQRIYEPLRVADQSRLIVAHGDVIVGYVYLLRMKGATEFGAHPRAQRLVPDLRRALVAAERLESTPDEPADFVMDPAGRVCFASDAGSEWMQVSGFTDALSRRIRDLDAGRSTPSTAALCAEMSVTRLGGTEGVRYLVHAARRAPLALSAAAALTPAQLEVAKLAAAGGTATEIGRMTGRSPETVRSHLAAVYRKLEVASRAELGREMAR